MRIHTRAPAVVGLLAALALVPGTSRGQAVTERSPNLGGTWLAEPRTVHFNFVHRFNTTPAPQRKVLNSPTFMVAARTPWRTMLGFAYATNSTVVQGIPNEWELFGRFVPDLGDAGRGALGAQVGWNAAALSVDGELSGGVALGRIRLLGTVRAFSNAFDAGEGRLAAGGGTAIQLTRWLALSGDAVTLLAREADERIGWSGGVQLGLPGTPHSMSINASNTNTTTLEGLSLGTATVRYGFEYTVPIHLDRFRRARPPARVATPDVATSGVAMSDVAAGSATADTVRVSIRSLAYGSAHLEVRRGAVVVWTNEDPIAHTVTATDGRFDSGALERGTSWAHAFEESGSFTVYCVPHPFMRATIVVRER